MSRPKIALPDDNRGWTLWSGRGRASEGQELVDIAGTGAGIAVGVPASECTSFAFRVPTADATLFPAMVTAQIERRGLAHHGDGAATPHQFRVIEQTGQETLIAVDVLSEDFPATLCLPQAAGYAPAARMLRLPEDKLMLWREHKRLVLAANRNGHLAHAQVLSAEPTLSAASAQEINLTVLSLQAEGLVDDTAELVVAGPLAGEREGKSVFEKALLIPTEFRPEPLVPFVGATDDRFLPLAVRMACQKRTTTRRSILAGALAALIYLAAGVLLWQHAEKTKATIADLERQVEETRPAVAEIQETEAHWREFEPAFDLHYYPLVQLNEVTRVMPGSGVLVREYETRNREIEVDGSAKDVQMAFRLKEDLEKNPFFRFYAWDMPQPKVERNNMATFRIQGKPKHEGTDD